jgi:hypothetical protein
MKQVIRAAVAAAAVGTAAVAAAAGFTAPTPAHIYLATAREPAAVSHAAQPATTCHIYNWLALPGDTYSAIAEAFYHNANLWPYVAALNPWAPTGIPAYAKVLLPYPYWCGRGAGLG